MKRIPGDKAIYEYTENLTPVETVKSGETVIFEANDCFYQQLRKEGATIEDLNMAHLNPATGPVEIEGAEVGDLLAVTIEKIDLSDFGTALCEPGHGVLGSLEFNRAQRDVRIEGKYAIFSDEIKIPLNPMVGVIGVASKAGNGSWQNAIPWKHGGNMDTTAIKEGSTLYLPVGQDGAMFALGDCHACMGDGEMSFAALEIKADVTVRFELIKNKGKNVEWPFLAHDDKISFIVSAETGDEASFKAAEVAIHQIAKALDISFEEAYMLGSLAVDLEVSQLVNPMKTYRATISTEILSLEKLLNSL